MTRYLATTIIAACICSLSGQQTMKHKKTLQGTLVRAEFGSKTGADDKDHDTCVFVRVTTADGGTQLAHVDDGGCSNDESQHYGEGQSFAIPLTIDAPTATREMCKGFHVHMWQRTHGGAGHDKWEIDDADVYLEFSDHMNLWARKDHFVLESRSTTDAPSAEFAESSGQ